MHALCSSSSGAVAVPKRVVRHARRAGLPRARSASCCRSARAASPTSPRASSRKFDAAEVIIDAERGQLRQPERAALPPALLWLNSGHAVAEFAPQSRCRDRVRVTSCRPSRSDSSRTRARGQRRLAEDRAGADRAGKGEITASISASPAPWHEPCFRGALQVDDRARDAGGRSSHARAHRRGAGNESADGLRVPVARAPHVKVRLTSPSPRRIVIRGAGRADDRRVRLPDYGLGVEFTRGAGGRRSVIARLNREVNAARSRCPRSIACWHRRARAPGAWAPAGGENRQVEIGREREAKRAAKGGIG